MGSKPTFGILLVLIGLFGVWLLVTGKLSAIVGFAKAAAVPGALDSSTPAANVVGGRSAPLGGSTVTPAAPGAVQNGTFLPPLVPSVAIPAPNFSLPALRVPTLGLTNLAPVYA